VSAIDDASSRDFEAEGLLDGLDGEVRAARLRLLERLVERGATLEQLRKAAAQDQLVVLSAELALGDERRYTGREIAELAAVPVEFLFAMVRAAGLAEPDPEEVAIGERSLDFARRLAVFTASR
jgi:adenylate cyclase